MCSWGSSTEWQFIVSFQGYVSLNDTLGKILCEQLKVAAKYTHLEISSYSIYVALSSRDMIFL